MQTNHSEKFNQEIQGQAWHHNNYISDLLFLCCVKFTVWQRARTN